MAKLTEDDKPQWDESVENSDKEPAEPEEVKELHRQKTGRPLLLGAEIDIQVQEYIKDVRRKGLLVLIHL